MEPSRGQKLLVIIGLAAILLALLILSLNHARQSREQMSVELVTPGPESGPHWVAVHVVGAVNRPGVYWLPQGARVTEAIAQAGGFRGDAEMSSVNMAAFVEDGRQINVASIGAATSAASPAAHLSPPAPAPAPQLTPVAGKAPSPAQSSSGHSLDTLPNQAISLSTASPAELAALPQVGETLALNIVYYRNQHGPFRSVSDLLKVPGFGEHRLEAVRPYVVP